MNTKRRITDKSNCMENNGYFENLRIKVNGRSVFKNCSFSNCTFIGKGKGKAIFESCTSR